MAGQRTPRSSGAHRTPRNPPAAAVKREDQVDAGLGAQLSELHLTDPQPVDFPGALLSTPDSAPVAVPAAAPRRRVHILRSENAAVGGAHYSLRAGAIMDLESSVVDELISLRLAEEI